MLYGYILFFLLSSFLLSSFATPLKKIIKRLAVVVIVLIMRKVLI